MGSLTHISYMGFVFAPIALEKKKLQVETGGMAQQLKVSDVKSEVLSSTCRIYMKNQLLKVIF